MGLVTAYCKFCGKKFAPQNPRDTFCAEKCRRGWINSLARERERKRAIIAEWGDLEWLNCALEKAVCDLRARIAEQRRKEAQARLEAGNYPTPLKRRREAAPQKDKGANDSDGG